MKKSIIALFLASVMAVALIGCTPSGGHQHQWDNYYVIDTATCEKEGKIERICATCGEKNYITVAKLEHEYVYGICDECGAEEGTVNVPDGVDKGYSLKEVYDVFKSYGYNVESDDFISGVSGYRVEGIHKDVLGHLCFTMIDGFDGTTEYPIRMVGKYIDFVGEFERGSLLVVSELKIENNVLSVIYVDGTVKELGEIDFSGSTAQPTEIIDKKVYSLGLNKQNELIVFFNNNTAKLIGKILDGQPAEKGVSVSFAKNGEYYNVVGLYDYNVVDIVVPATHRGITVDAIGREAFAYLDIKSAVIEEGVKEIGDGAFNATLLKTIKIPSSVTIIGSRAFAYCDSELKVVIPSTVEYIGLAAFYTFSDKVQIFCEVNEKPADWDAGCFNGKATVYYSGEWSYVNGEPTPNA